MSPAKPMLISGHVDQGLPITNKTEKLNKVKSAATDPVLLRIIDEQLVELLGEEYTRLPFIDPNPQTGRTYEDGEEINSNLPAAYQPAANAEWIPN